MIIPSNAVSIKDFADSLIVDFNSRETIPYDVNEENWRQWGNIVASSPTFARNNVPTTENFPSWQEWGIIMYETMAK